MVIPELEESETEHTPNCIDSIIPSLYELIAVKSIMPKLVLPRSNEAQPHGQTGTRILEFRQSNLLMELNHDTVDTEIEQKVSDVPIVEVVEKHDVLERKLLEIQFDWGKMFVQLLKIQYRFWIIISKNLYLKNKHILKKKICH